MLIGGKQFWETFGVTRIISKKHPGAVFFKVNGTRDDFICKFYPGHEQNAKDFEEWANQRGILTKDQQKVFEQSNV